MPEGQFRGDKPAAAPDVRAGFKDRGIAAERGLAGAASKQELPAGRASPAKELFTLPVTQIPAGLAGAPRSPQGLAAGPGTRFIPAGIWPAVPGPLASAAGLCPVLHGAAHVTPFSRCVPSSQVPGAEPLPAHAGPRWGPGQGEGSEQAPALARPPQNRPQPEPQSFPVPLPPVQGCTGIRLSPARQGERRDGERGAVSPEGLQGLRRAGTARAAATEERCSRFWVAPAPCSPSPCQPAGQRQGIARELPPQVLQAQLSSLRLPDPARRWKSPRAADAGQALIGSTAGPHARTASRAPAAGGCGCRGASGNPARGAAGDPGK